MQEHLLAVVSWMEKFGKKKKKRKRVMMKLNIEQQDFYPGQDK